jgi:tetratricopeptide (TPR) repeat protein
MRSPVLALALLACGGRQTPAPQTNRTVIELNAAEDAERHRQHDVARTHYEAAVASAQDPKSAGIAHREFAETLATWGEIEDARTHLEAAVVVTPQDPIAWQMLGILRAKLGDVPGGFTALEKSKALAPRAWIPRRDLAALHWKLGEGRDKLPDPAQAEKQRAAALAEYEGMLDLELPARVREKVKWAIDLLSKPAGDIDVGTSR